MLFELVPTVAFPCALVCDPGLLKRADGIKKAGNVVVYNVLRRIPTYGHIGVKNQALTGPRRTGGINFYTYIGPSNHAFKLIGSWAAMALVELLLPWDARPLFI